MIEALLILLIIVNIGGFYVLHRKGEDFPIVDLEQISGAITSRLIEQYGDEIVTLTEQGVKQYSRERYVMLSAASGLSLDFTDKVSSRVWEQLQVAQGGVGV